MSFLSWGVSPKTSWTRFVHTIFAKLVFPRFDIEDSPHLIKALEEGPYGRCVYETDNDVCDNQVVNLDFGHAAATMTMVAFSEEVCYRKMCIYGSEGEISTDSRTIRLFDFATKEKLPSLLQKTNNLVMVVVMRAWLLPLRKP
jgi:hypothetical protein